jgi:hypothetical protein
MAASNNICKIYPDPRSLIVRLIISHDVILTLIQPQHVLYIFRFFLTFIAAIQRDLQGTRWCRLPEE